MSSIQLAGCAIINNGKLLLIWKKRHEHYEFPGGKVEEGESFRQAALRETKEEIDCDVNIIKYLGYKEFSVKGSNFQSHKYLAEIPEGQTPKVAEPELFGDIFWLPMAEYKEYDVAPNVAAFCQDYIDGRLNL